MKKAFVLALVLCIVSPYVFAQDAEVISASVDPTAASVSAISAGEITLKGDIIDNRCALAQKAEDLAGFVKTHTKQYALMPDCVASGYSIFADGKLNKFDKEGSAKIEEFLKKEDSKLQAVVKATKAESSDELILISIENQEDKQE